MRIIDGKFHIEGEEIIKTSNGEAIPREEPLILFRARDYLALPMLHWYRRRCLDAGCTDFQMNGIDAIITKFGEFRQQQADRMKQPGITRGL